MPKFETKNRIVVVMQKKEFGICTNTGHLIPKIFNNSALYFRGNKDKSPLNLDFEINKEEFSPVVLFPSPEAKILTPELMANYKKPLQLFVLDGNWRQASKMMKRIPCLYKMPKVILPDLGPSRYRLRISPRDDGVCTLEAIARAIGIIESPSIQEKTEDFFNTMVERVLWTRGKIKENPIK